MTTPSTKVPPNQSDLRRMFVDVLCSVRGGRKLPDVVLDRLIEAVATWVDMKPGLVEARDTTLRSAVVEECAEAAEEVAHSPGMCSHAECIHANEAAYRIRALATGEKR